MKIALGLILTIFGMLLVVYGISNIAAYDAREYVIIATKQSGMRAGFGMW